MRLRKPTKLGFIGVVLTGAGVTGLAWGSLNDFRPDRVGVALFVVGLGAIGYKRLEASCRRLEQKNLAGDEIYRTAYDRGREDGYDEGYEDRGKEAPIRPVIVPLPVQSCPDCGHSLGLQPVGTVADRG